MESSPTRAGAEPAMGVDDGDARRRHMRERPSGSRFGGWAWVLPTALLMAFCAWRIVSIAMADRLATQDPSEALAWVSGQPDALVELAARELAAGHPERASDHARRLLRMAPLDGRGFRILAESELRAGRPDRAVVLFDMAKHRSPRDIPSRAWLLQFALARNDAAAVLREAEFLLRTAPDTRDALVPLLARLSARPDFALALSASLRDDPQWREELGAAVRDARAGTDVRGLACWLVAIEDSMAHRRCHPGTAAADAQAASDVSGVAEAIVASVADRPPVPAGR